MVEKIRICGASSHQMEKRQSYLVFVDQVEQAGFQVNF